MKISRSPFSEGTEDLGGRHIYLAIVAIGFFFLLLTQLWYLQIIRGSEFRTLSESNRTRVQDILPPRGLILDRHDRILVDNHPSFELMAIREDISDIKTLAGRLSALLSLPLVEVYESLEATRNKPAFKPAAILSGLSRERLVAFETHRYELPGLFIQDKPQRKYLHERLASHVIGYMSQVSQAQLEDSKYRSHRIGDMVGRCGIEQRWESYLKGHRGRRLVEVDASGRVLKVIKQVNPTPGHNIHLTLDPRLQRTAKAALGDQAGAVVALDPRNGTVLAMASTPTFNQNDFVPGISPDKWKQLINNPLHPLENRALSGQYPPGSTFKIIAAAAALEAGLITPETTFTCTGGLLLGDRTFRCWRKGGHGKVDLHRALVGSCDVYFYELGLRLGVDRLAEYSRAFGLGRPTGVCLAGEKPGLVPTRAWKKKRFGDRWHKGETLSVVIGQGYNLATPIQMALVTAAISNGGRVFIPQLVKKITDSEGRVVKSFKPMLVRRLDLRPETLNFIMRCLAGVVNEPRGTGRRARLEGISVGGKTGTSQVVARSRTEETNNELPYKYRDHAWFVAFAPVESPRIAVAVVVEHGGHGGKAAAPIARQVLQAFFYPDEPLMTAAAAIEQPTGE